MLGLCCLAASAPAQQIFYVNRSTDNGAFQTGEGTSVGGFSGDLRYCLIQSQYYQNPSGRTTTTLIVQTNVTLTKPLPPWTPNVAQDLTIRSDGGVYTISGGNTARHFFFEAPGSTMTLRDLVLTGGRGKGGDGLGGGGGGAGLGGAVFVGAGTLYSQNVSFVSNTALGGTANTGTGGGGGGFGASGGNGTSSGGGGGGGFFGGGGWGATNSGGGGGGLIWAGNNAASSFGGGGGGLTPAGQPDTRSPGANGGTGGDNAQLGGDHDQFVSGLDAPLPGGGGGGGGNGSLGGGFFTPAPGGAGNKYGGGGGAGPRGNGGRGADYGGGGGAPGQGGIGGNGGFGGGGGAGDSTAGLGGFGAGNGSRSFPTAIASTAGSGLGGGVFLRTGAAFVFQGGALSGNTVAAGGGGGGTAQGNGIYMMGGSYLTFNLQTGFQQIPNDIAGDGEFRLSSGGTTLSLSGTNTYNGLTIIEGGTLRIETPAALSPNSILNIYDFGRLDLFGNSLTMTPAQLGGSTGFVSNDKPGTPITVTLNAPAGANRDVSVKFQDGVSTLALIKAGAGPLQLTNFNTFTGGFTVNAGTVTLQANNGGVGTLAGAMTINAGTSVTATASNAFGYSNGVKLNAIAINNGGVLIHSAPADQGWGIAYTLNNGAIMDFGAGSTSTSAWAFGGPGPGVLPNANTSVLATGATPSEIRGRVELRGDNGNTSVSFNVASGANLRIPALIANQPLGTVFPALAKDGPGLLRLSATNTYTGNTVVNAGTLELAVGGGFGAILGNLTINAGGTVKTSVTDAVGFVPGRKVNAITINGGATLLHASPGNQGWGVAYTLDNGAIMDFGTGTDATSAWAFGGPGGAEVPANSSVLATGAAASSIRGRIDLRPNNGNTNVNFTVNGGATLNVPAVIFSALSPSPSVTKAGAGTLVLSGTNTYGGGTILAGGTLAIANASALGSGGSLTFSGGTLRYDFSPSAGSDLSSRFVAPASGQAVRLDTNGQSVTLAATPLGGAGALIKSGAGTLTLNGAQTYSGGTTILGGTLRLGDGTVAGSFTGNVANAGTLEFAPPGAQSYAGVVSGTGGLTKSGPGTLSLAAAQSFTGATTVSAGTLALGSAASLSTGGVSIGSSGTLSTGGSAINGLVSVTGLLNGTGGALNAGLSVNTGGRVALTAGSLTLGGAVVNNGTIRLTSGATLLAGGATSFVNNGLIDLITAGAGSTLPANFVNGVGGIVLTGSSVRVKDVVANAGAVTVRIDGYTGHTYRLQRSSSLNAGTFQNVAGVAPQDGLTGNVLTFTDPSPDPLKGIYRILVNP